MEAVKDPGVPKKQCWTPHSSFKNSGNREELLVTIGVLVRRSEKAIDARRRFSWQPVSTTELLW